MYLVTLFLSGCLGANRRSGEWGSFSSILRYRLGTRNCQAFNAYSHPFYGKTYRSTHHKDLVFVPRGPPDAGKDFRLSIKNVWYCRVLQVLLFSFHTSTDSGIKRHDCAFVSLLWEYDADLPGAK
jgi:hypothetical protein